MSVSAEAGAPRRRFFVVGHTQSTDASFSLTDLAGAAGRIDVLARAVTSALCLSHGLRSDTEVWTVIDHEDVADGPRTLVWRGDRLRNLNPDERSTAALFRKAFAADVVDHLEEVHPGLEAGVVGLREAIELFRQDAPLLLLDKAGDDLRTMPSERLLSAERPPGFVLSDHRPWDDAERAFLDDVVDGMVSAGPHWLHGHHVITLVQDEIDRRSTTPAPTGEGF